ncbi:hypothetical protein XANCAGTX0491_004076 [Xanthoria calcicola]
MSLSMQPPPDGDTNTGSSILIITWLCTGISTVVVGLKIWTRLNIIRQFGADDVLTISALLLLLAFAPLITISVHEGLGRHNFYLTPEASIRSAKLAILSNPLVFLAAAWPNISVAISLDRILVPHPWPRAFLYGIPIVQCLFALICSIVTYTECSPLEALWNPFIPHRCLPPKTVVGILDANGALSAFTHIFLAVVPIFGLWKIRIKTKTKVGVCLLMGTTAIIEAAFIIMAACIPSLRPFVRSLGKSLHIDSARSLFVVPKGYHHSHSRRHRPAPLVPRDSGSGAPGSMALGSGSTAQPSPRDKYESGGDVEKGERNTARLTPQSTAATRVEKISEEEERGRRRV